MELSNSELAFINTLIEDTINHNHVWIRKPFSGVNMYSIKSNDFKVIFSIRETEFTKIKEASLGANINEEMISIKIGDWDSNFPLAVKLLDAIIESIDKDDNSDNLSSDTSQPFVASYTTPTKPNPSF